MDIQSVSVIKKEEEVYVYVYVYIHVCGHKLSFASEYTCKLTILNK